MSTSATRGGGILLTGILAIGLSSAHAFAAQDTSSLLSGLVVDDASGRPIAGAVVSLPELGARTETGAGGQFSLDNLRVGAVTVRFEAPGYMSVTEELVLSEVEFFQVRLVAVAAALDEIVVLAGRTPGARASRVDVRNDEPSSTSVLDLLADQIPGVTVRRGGGNIGGGGAGVIIRGVGTFQGATAPEVYLDGVRLDGRDTGEHAMHILERIPAAEVARIRVLKGAAASSPYAFSANGAIVIETHRGGARQRS
jgi:outer membrane receptor protein involved in Fe transport